MFGAFTFIADHRMGLVALALVIAGGAARVYIPVVGRQVATVAWIAAAAAGAWDAGYSTRAASDRSAEIAAQATQLRADLASANAIADAASRRAETAESQHADDQNRVSDYEKKLVQMGDCALTDADRGRLRAIGGAPARPAASAGRLRQAGRPAGPVKGAKAMLAEYRAALAVANRRLVNDAAFYADVRARFGAH